QTQQRECPELLVPDVQDLAEGRLSLLVVPALQVPARQHDRRPAAELRIPAFDRALPVAKRLVDLALLLGDYAQAQQRRSRVALVAGIESDLPGLPRPDPVVLLLIAHGHEAGGPRAVLGILRGHRLSPGDVCGALVALPRAHQAKLKGGPGRYLLSLRFVEVEDVLQPFGGHSQLTLVLRKTTRGAHERRIGRERPSIPPDATRGTSASG